MTTHANRHKLFARFRFSVLATSLLFLAACGNGTNSAAEPALPDETTQEQVNNAAVESTTGSLEASSLGTTLTVSATDRAAILAKYNYLDPQRMVPTKALEDAVIYWDQNKAKIKNVSYLGVINFAQSSKEKRFYIIDMKSGSVWAIHTAHGKGSDPTRSGYATKFSNQAGSNASSLGFYMTAETYNGSHGLSLKLDGLSSTNSNARARAIVVHGADYVQESSIIQGRSWGCPAVSMDLRTKVINTLKNGSLIYATVDNGGTSRAWSSASGTTTTPVTTTPSAQPTPVAADPGVYNVTALSWENSSHPEREAWSDYLMTLVLKDWNSLLKGASDMTNFCPKYYSLNNNQRANVWAQLFSAMARYESAYSPTSRMQETTMGTDPVTGKPVYSEGLLQLSYQDKLANSFCKFDWSKDKNLSSTDPRKTILDPFINLHCGVGIMAKQIARKNTIAIGSGAYWAVIKTNSRYNQLSSITSMVKNFALCR